MPRAARPPRAGATRKYRNEPVETPDGRFDSKGEYGRWCALKIAERAGWIRNLRRQVRYALLPGKRGDGIELVADFAYEHANGTAVVEDFKSPASMTPVFKLKLRLFRHAYPETVFLISGKDGAIKRASGRALAQPTPEDAR